MYIYIYICVRFYVCDIQIYTWICVFQGCTLLQDFYFYFVYSSYFSYILWSHSVIVLVTVFKKNNNNKKPQLFIYLLTYLCLKDSLVARLMSCKWRFKESKFRCGWNMQDWMWLTCWAAIAKWYVQPIFSQCIISRCNENIRDRKMCLKLLQSLFTQHWISSTEFPKQNI